MSDRTTIHDLIVREPPALALEWARRGVGPKARVVSVSVLAGGTSHANHALVIETPRSTVEVVLRRWVRPDWQETDLEFSAANESATYGLLAKTKVRAPRLLTADVDAIECDVPALLLTRAPGRRIGSAGVIASRVRPLAEAIHQLHVSAAPDASRILLPYSPFCEPARVAIPPWSEHPDSWRHAVELAMLAGLDACAFIHRDYHPGNTIWVGDAVSAIVDWTTASWGPPSVDLSHMRVNLAMSAGLDVADAFRDAYESVSGSGPLDPVWDLRMAVDFVPDLDAAHATADELRRLDDFVLAALAAL